MWTWPSVQTESNIKGSHAAVSIESFYSVKVYDETGPGAGASNTNVVVDSYYVNPVPK